MRKRYRNLSGNSGVVSYETGPDWIAVTFRGGTTYLYDESEPGSEAVEKMKRLAAAGRGLSTYISQHVGERYADRLDDLT